MNKEINSKEKMYSELNEFQAKKKYLVAIDSDGCVFDTMTLKHQKFFFPLLEEELGLEEWNDTLRVKWEDINLYTSLRGINRFLGVYYLLKDVDPKEIPVAGKTTIYNDYIENHKQITLEGLSDLFDQTGDEFVGSIVKWSKNVNISIKKYMPIVDAFKESKLAIAEIAKVADIAVVSSANQEALFKEWGEAKLLEHVAVLTSQTDGSKQHILKELLAKGYRKEDALMIGDAPGDEKAALANEVEFRLVEAGKENLSWINIRQEIENGGIFNHGN